LKYFTKPKKNTRDPKTTREIGSRHITPTTDQVYTYISQVFLQLDLEKR
jgi:hypothetical protein